MEIKYSHRLEGDRKGNEVGSLLLGFQARNYKFLESLERTRDAVVFLNDENNHNFYQYISLLVPYRPEWINNIEYRILHWKKDINDHKIIARLILKQESRDHYLKIKFHDLNYFFNCLGSNYSKIYRRPSSSFSRTTVET